MTEAKRFPGIRHAFDDSDLALAFSATPRR